MRIYEVKSDKETAIVAAHNPKQAAEVSNLKKVLDVSEVDIHNPVIIKKWQNTQTDKSVNTSEK